MNISQRQIAAAAGVSVSTVSKALGGTTEATRLNPLTVQRVLDVALQLGYQPNDHARALRSNRSGLIGIFFGSGHHAAGRSVLAGYLATRILDGIEEAVVPAGRDLLLINFTRALGDPERLRRVLVRKRLDGMLGVGMHETPELLEIVQARGLPTVLIDDLDDSLGTDVVVMDTAQAIKGVVDHLVGLGHRHIGYIGPLHPSVSPAQRRRFDCLQVEVQARNLPWSASHVIDGNHVDRVLPRKGNFSLHDGLVGAGLLLDRNPSITAIIAYNDLAAAGTLQCLAQRGIACPWRVSVTGFGNYDIAESIWPSLTTVDYPLARMGKIAAQRLLDLSGEDSESSGSTPQTIRVPGELVLRASTGPSPLQ